MSIVDSGCCCDGETGIMRIAYACWPNRSRAFSFTEPTGANITTAFNGTLINSTNPPTSTPGIVWMVGGGGGSQSTDVIGGAGAILEKQTTLPASSIVKVGQGGFGGTGTVSSVARVFGGGAKGAANASSEGKSYGGGATGWTGASGMIAGGGGGGGSPEFFTQYGTDAYGGDAGIASAIDPCGNTGCGNGANGATPGTGGTLGTQVTAVAGFGGTGTAQASGVAGGGGGGGGYAGGGSGTNTAGSPPVYGGGPGGGGDSIGYTVATSEAGLNGQTQQNAVSITAGDGGIDAQGNDGYLEIFWRKCEECQCPEATTGLPPSLYICLNQVQYDAIVAAAAVCDFNVYGDYWIVFKYLGWPYMLQRNPFLNEVINPKPCTRTVLTADIDTANSHYVSSQDGCCEITTAVLYNDVCTDACTEKCPDAIYLCNEYMTQIGAPLCRDPNKFYKIDYLGCVYLLAVGASDYQCDGTALTPLNVGTYGGEYEVEPIQYTYTVGPTLFEGGFTCCAPITVTANVNWSSVVNVVQYSDVCCDGTAMFPLYTSNPGTAAGTFEMVCNATTFTVLNASPNACVPTTNPCGCGKTPCDATSTTLSTVGGNCNPAASDPCQSQVTTKRIGLTLDLLPDPGSTPFLTLTLTRATASSGTSWTSVDTITGTIYIDDCVFTGSGTAKTFNAKINETLAGCVVGTASSEAWLGDRCCTSAPLDCSPCRGGSDNWFLDSISTTVAVYKATYSVWAVLTPTYSINESGCRVCAGDDPCENVLRCCSGDGYTCSATWTTELVPEEYGVTPTGGSFMPCVLTSDGCDSNSPPVSTQGGGDMILS